MTRKSAADRLAARKLGDKLAEREAESAARLRGFYALAAATGRMPFGAGLRALDPLREAMRDALSEPSHDSVTVLGEAMAAYLDELGGTVRDFHAAAEALKGLYDEQSRDVAGLRRLLGRAS